MPVAQWIVQPPSDADPTSLLHCDADCVTLLSGADQAAVVGAYRMLKGLIAATKEEGALPTIQLVIVGAEERASSDAATRIIQTAHHQLGVKIDVAEPLPAMNSSNNVLSQVSFARTSNMVDFMSRLRLEPVGEELSEELPLTHRFNIEKLRLSYSGLTFDCPPMSSARRYRISGRFKWRFANSCKCRGL